MMNARKRQQAELHYRKFMQIIGMDTKGPHAKDTPARVVRMMEEMTAGIGPCSVRTPVFPNNGDQLVVVAPIPFSSMCAHHHLPFIGNAAVGYLPDKHITGISKFKRVIDHYSARPQTQEDLVNEIADYLDKTLKAKALFVLMDARHTCMGARGVRTPCSCTLTHAIRGEQGYDHAVKQEFLALVLPKMPKE